MLVAKYEIRYLIFSIKSFDKVCEILAINFNPLHMFKPIRVYF